MKLIKFRCRDPLSKKIVGYEVCINGLWTNSKNIECTTHRKGVIKGKYIREQFTGLFDRNSKEIYENDVIKGINDRFGDLVFWEYSLSCGCHDDSVGYRYSLKDARYLEVIGDKYTPGIHYSDD